MLDVRRLRLLREVAARRTIAAAAEALAFTPSAVSQQLSALEREAGVALLERDGRGVRLTDAARRLVAHTEVILADLERAEADLAAAGTAVRGTVRLAAFMTAARALVPPAVAAVRVRHPALRVLLQEGEPHETLPALRLGELDVAVVHRYDLLPAPADAGVVLRSLRRDPLWLALPPGDPLAGEPGRPVRLADLQDRRWVAGAPETSCYHVVLQSCALAGYRPAIDFHSNDFTVVLALVEAGLGVALVPGLALHATTTRAELRPVAELPLSRELFAAARSGSDTTPAVTAVLDALEGLEATQQVGG